ncbi:MAG: class I SAM-dependent methyltransferase [Alphaproteobacteria bacterium]
MPQPPSPDEQAREIYRRVGANYDQAPRWFIPGYAASHAMAAVILSQRIGPAADILVVGAGTGTETLEFARHSAQWRFLGVDPSPEMLTAAQAKFAPAGIAGRARLLQGTVADAPRVQFDAATAFLALHYVPDDGSRLEQTREVHARLRPGAPFLLINTCIDRASPEFERELQLCAAFGTRNGAPPQAVARVIELHRGHTAFVTPEREQEILREAGFREIATFYRALWFHGFVATA